MKIEGLSTANIDNAINAKQNSDVQAFEDVLQKAYTDGDKVQLKEACKEFEGILLNMMFKQMKKTIPESGLFEKSYAREMFEEMLDEEIINNASQRGIGVADVMYKQLSLNIDNMYEISDEGKQDSKVDISSAENNASSANNINSANNSSMVSDEYKVDSQDKINITDKANNAEIK